MKLVCLNTYEGHFLPPLLKFIRESALTADIFCFQEMTTTNPGAEAKNDDGAISNLLEQIMPLLPNWQLRFAPVQDGFGNFKQLEDNIRFGLATFVRPGNPIESSGDSFISNGYNTFVFNDYTTLGHKLLYITLLINKTKLTVCNVHGTSTPINKLDSPVRLEQSKKILDFLKDKSGEKVIAGDFNLLPHTASIQIFEPAGFRNLIKEWGITTTRGTLLKQIHPEYGLTPEGFQEFADYAFVTPGIKVHTFQVPDLPISDHLPLIVDFAL